MAEEKDKGGRPMFVFDDDQIEAITGLAAVLNKSQLAGYFGISETTFLECEKRQPAVSVAYKKGRNLKISQVANNLVTKALDGDTTAAMFYLKTQAGWKETQHVQQETKQVESFTDLYGNSES